MKWSRRPPRLQAAVISRLKIMARLDIAERRLPQDGRIRLTVRGHEIDFRVSTIPSLHGETVILRVLDRTAVQFDYHRLGFPAELRGGIERCLELPNGMVLVTGPTGSGKTTTLYTGLLKLNTLARKVVTVEDPIEYQLAGINQIQVKPQIGPRADRICRARWRRLTAPAPNTASGSPTLDDRIVRTRVAVQDGRTVALAGLIRDNAQEGNSGIPVLKDIPLLGTLFSSKNSARGRTELLVLITPQVAKDPRDARVLTDDLRNELFNAAVVPQDLPRKPVRRRKFGNEHGVIPVRMLAFCANRSGRPRGSCARPAGHANLDRRRVWPCKPI